MMHIGEDGPGSDESDWIDWSLALVLIGGGATAILIGLAYLFT